MRAPAEEVTKILNYRDSGTVLDIGSGYGRHSIFLAQHGFEVTAIEPDRQQFLRLQEEALRLGLSIRAMNQTLDELPPSKTYDIVVATMLVHFMPSQAQAHEAIKKIQALTTVGGLNCVSVLLKKRANNQKPYLFEDDELKDCYGGWDILFYTEKLGLPYHPAAQAKKIRSYAARLLAEKSE